MKTRKDQFQSTTEKKVVDSCCGPTLETIEQTDPCCEQPKDGSSCCDKNSTKEVNAAKTGCC